jgi:hypothetical protein
MTIDFDTATAGAFIDQATAQHVLWHFGSGGYEPGSFTKHLMLAITTADPANQTRLSLGFPGYVAAVQLAQNSETGIVTLTAIAKGTAR